MGKALQFGKKNFISEIISDQGQLKVGVKVFCCYQFNESNVRSVLWYCISLSHFLPRTVFGIQ